MSIYANRDYLLTVCLCLKIFLLQYEGFEDLCGILWRALELHPDPTSYNNGKAALHCAKLLRTTILFCQVLMREEV